MTYFHFSGIIDVVKDMSEKELEEIFGTSAIFDKDSSEYRESAIINNIVNNVRKDDDDPLSVALSQATHLDETKKQRYIYLAGLFLEDMHHNLFKNQFELNNRYPDATIDEWNDFLSDRIVSVYIKKHKRTLLKNTAEDNLADPFAKNKRDNLKLIENLEAQEQAEQNRNICIIRIPDIYDES